MDGRRSAYIHGGVLLRAGVGRIVEFNDVFTLLVVSYSVIVAHVTEVDTLLPSQSRLWLTDLFVPLHASMQPFAW